MLYFEAIYDYYRLEISLFKIQFVYLVKVFWKLEKIAISRNTPPTAFLTCFEVFITYFYVINPHKERDCSGQIAFKLKAYDEIWIKLLNKCFPLFQFKILLKSQI